jgi:hypothetical protein
MPAERAIFHRLQFHEKTPRDAASVVPLGRLELPFLAPEANALSTELQGRVSRFYHE